MIGFFKYLLRKNNAPQIAPETPVEVWIIKYYKTLFKCHIKDQTWGESEFNRMTVEPGEYGIGNPVIIVINTINDKKITGEAIDRDKFILKYGEVPTLNNNQAAADQDAEYEMLAKAVKEIGDTVDRIMKR